MPRSIGVRQLPSRRCGCERCRKKYPKPERAAAKNCTANWQARWYDAAGNEQTATRRTKTEALAARNTALAAIGAGTYQDPKRGQITISAWRDLWLKGRTVERATTARDTSHWSAHLKKRWGGVPLRNVTYMDVQAWVAKLETTLAAATVRSILNSLDMLMAAALLDQRIPFNPCDGIKTQPPKRRHASEERPPTPDQVKAACSHTANPLYRRVPLLLLETGLRWGEITGVCLDALDLDDGTLDVRRVLEEVGGHKILREYPKSDAGFRTVPLTRVALALWREHLAEQPAIDGEPVLRGPNGAWLGRNNFRSRVWLPATIAAGIHRVRVLPSGKSEHWPTVHDIRHTWASRLENGGVPESTRKELLGHERPRSDVTWRYTHGAEDIRALVLAALGDRPEPRSHAVQRTKMRRRRIRFSSATTPTTSDSQ